jgi:hypothetical protein
VSDKPKVIVHECGFTDQEYPIMNIEEAADRILKLEEKLAEAREIVQKCSLHCRCEAFHIATNWLEKQK